MHQPLADLPRAPLPPATIRTIVLGLMLAMFLSALDQTIVATALPIIGRDLHDIHNLSWVVTVYLLAATAVTPLYGKLSDIHGRRTMLLVGIGVFIAGSAACALAPTMPALIVARAVQGLGGGGLIALAQTTIADIMAPRERAQYQAYFGAVFATASIAGPVLGGIIAEHLHWSVIFWINLPLGVAALAMSYTALRALPAHHRPRHLDVIGAVLMAAGSVNFLLALSWGGTRYPWTSAPILGLFAAALFLWATFAVRVVTTPEPFLPLSLLRNPVVRNGTIAAFFGMGTNIGLSIYVPLYLQSVLGLSASHSGLALIPLMGGTVVGAQTSGRMMARVAHYKRLPTIGLCCGIVVLLMLAAFPDRLPLTLIVVLLAIVGIAVGSLFPVTTVAIQNAVTVYELGTATATMNFFRQLGGAIIVAVFGAIMLAGVGSAGGEGISPELLAQAGTDTAQALAVTFRYVFLAAAGGFAAALVFLVLMDERPLRDRSAGAPPAE